MSIATFEYNTSHPSTQKQRQARPPTHYGFNRSLPLVLQFVESIDNAERSGHPIVPTQGSEEVGRSELWQYCRKSTRRALHQTLDWTGLPSRDIENVEGFQ